MLEDCGHVPQVERSEQTDRAAAALLRARRRAAARARARGRARPSATASLPRGAPRRCSPLPPPSRCCSPRPAPAPRSASPRRRAPARDAHRPRHRPAAADALDRRAPGRPPRAARAPTSACAAASRQGRHRLRACRGRSCSTSAPFVVTNGPIVGGCPVFPPDSPWNTDVSAPPLAADSATLVGAQAAGHDVHLDFGDTQSEYGIPYALVPATQRRVPIAFGTDGADYGDESDHGPFPIPPARADRGRAGRAARPDRRATATSSSSSASAAWTTSSTTRCGVDGGASWQVSSVGALGPHAQRAPPRGLDLGRRRRAADPPRAAALRRGRLGHDPPRAALHAAARAARLAGARGPLRHDDRPLRPALRLALAAEGLLRRVALQRARRWPSSARSSATG